MPKIYHTSEGVFFHLVTVLRDENEILLCYKPAHMGKRDYFILWGNKNKYEKGVLPIKTKSGRRPAWKSVMKQFHETVDAIQHLKFS
jgi:hypothetical protein